MTPVYKVLWRMNLRPMITYESVAAESIHWRRFGSFVNAADYIWNGENVFLHHIDDREVIFLKTKKGFPIYDSSIQSFSRTIADWYGEEFITLPLEAFRRIVDDKMARIRPMGDGGVSRRYA